MRIVVRNTSSGTIRRRNPEAPQKVHNADPTTGAFRCYGANKLGTEAIYEFEVKDMPVTVAVDPAGDSIHETGPTGWRAKIAKIPILAP